MGENKRKKINTGSVVVVSLIIASANLILLRLLVDHSTKPVLTDGSQVGLKTIFL